MRTYATHTQPHRRIPAVASVPESSFPRCRTHFPVISLHTHFTGALNLRRWRLLGGFGPRAASEDITNNCLARTRSQWDASPNFWWEVCTCTSEFHANYCRPFRLLKVSWSHRPGFMNQRYAFKYPDPWGPLLTYFMHVYMFASYQRQKGIKKVT